MNTVKELIIKLTETAKQIRDLEAQAYRALYDQNNPDLHKSCLIEKALLLSTLQDKIDEMTTSIEPKLAQTIKSQIGAFSFSAGKALDLNSVFYMSALLYPEEYTDGDNNDLENFISDLEDHI